MGTNSCAFRWRWNTLTCEAWPVASSVTAEKHVGEAALPDQSRQDASPPYYSPLVFFVTILIALPRYPALLAPGSPSFSLACRGLFHLDFHAHPGMDAALKKMFTFRQIRDLYLAAGFGSWLPRRSKSRRHIRERVLSHIEPRYSGTVSLRTTFRRSFFYRSGLPGNRTGSETLHCART